MYSSEKVKFFGQEFFLSVENPDWWYQVISPL
jgi:hypothetical protein